MDGTTKDFAVLALRELANEIAEGRVVVKRITVEQEGRGGAARIDRLARCLDIEVGSPAPEQEVADRAQ